MKNIKFNVVKGEKSCTIDSRQLTAKKPLLLYFMLLILFSCTEIHKTAFYVSPSGNDQNAGTEQYPFKTIAKARDTIRKLQTEGNNGIEVILMQGKYLLSETLLFNEKDSGRTLIYKAAKGKKVILTGAFEIPTKSARPVSDPTMKRSIKSQVLKNIFEIDLNAEGINNYGKLEQFGYAQDVKPAPISFAFNNKPLHHARFPNSGWLKILDVLDSGSIPRVGDTTRRGGEFTFDFNEASAWKHTDDLWLHGFFAHGYPDDNIKVEYIDTVNKTIKLAQPHLYGVSSSLTDEWDAHTRRYYVFNLPEEIDMPGEYYLDRASGKLYFYPPGDIETGILQVSHMQAPLMALTNTSDITFKGIIFENSPGMGVYSENSNNITFDNCVFRNFGTVALSFGQGVEYNNRPVHDFTGTPASFIIGNMRGHLYQNSTWNRLGGKNCTIKNSKIYNTGSGGIYLDGGDRKSLQPGNHLVENCEFFNTSTRYTFYCPSVLITGVGIEVNKCFFHDIEQHAIFYHGNEHLIQNNIFKRVCTNGDDVSAIYIGRNPSSRGTVIRNNYFENIGKEGHTCASIYFDDIASGNTVTKNVFKNAASGLFSAVVINSGSYNKVVNNVFIDTKMAAVDVEEGADRKDIIKKYTKNGLYQKRLEAVNYKQAPYANRYKNISTFMEDSMMITRENIISKNIFVRTRAYSLRTKKDSAKYIAPDNYFTNSEDVFIKPGAGNYSIKKDAKTDDILKNIEDINVNSAWKE